MAKQHKHSVCPLCMAGVLDNRLRRFFTNPNKILKPYIKKNTVALDFGCGPGVFTTEMAALMEGTGKVIAVDMQAGMLNMVRRKIEGKPFEKNVALHQCTQEKVGVSEQVDFVLMFYVVHEVPNKENLFDEILPLINKNGRIMMVEPKMALSKKEFTKIIDKVKQHGFEEERSSLSGVFSRGIVLKKL